MKILIRIILISVVVIIVGLIGYFVYLKATYIDDTVLAGEAYGFKIGDTQEETYFRTKNAFDSQAVFILFPLDKNGYGPHKELKFTDEEFNILREREKWEFFFDDGFFDSLKLTFKNGKLTSIHRHRQKFELP